MLRNRPWYTLPNYACVGAVWAKARWLESVAFQSSMEAATLLLRNSPRCTLPNYACVGCRWFKG